MALKAALSNMIVLNLNIETISIKSLRMWHHGRARQVRWEEFPKRSRDYFKVELEWPPKNLGGKDGFGSRLSPALTIYSFLNGYEWMDKRYTYYSIVFQNIQHASMAAWLKFCQTWYDWNGWISAIAKLLPVAIPKWWWHCAGSKRDKMIRGTLFGESTWIDRNGEPVRFLLYRLLRSGPFHPPPASGGGGTFASPLQACQLAAL